MKHLAVIPARSGSKGLLNKNIKTLCGKPLLAYSVEAALDSGIFDTVHVSTDSDAYAEIARRFGADIPFLRSPASATDTASSWSVLLEALDRYEALGQRFDTVTLLQPTSPLRKAEDIRAAYGLFQQKKAHAVVSVCAVDHPPIWSNTLPQDLCMDGFLKPEAKKPRQSFPEYYRINGAIYIADVNSLRSLGTLVYDKDCFAFMMPRERSIDIDEELDFVIAEAILKHRS